MRRLLPALLLAMTLTANAESTSPQTGRTALVIHGGAGFVPKETLTAQDTREIRDTLNRALDAGDAVLKRGGSAIDAVEAAILVLEESPRFNAGKGAVFNAKGGHELDASIMEGHTRRAGAVAGVTTVRNPIRLARAVMEKSPHVMLAGAGAEAFADTQKDIERVPNTWFDTPMRRKQLDEAQAKENTQRAAVITDDDGNVKRYLGTVGAVALDKAGHIAAGTSTGGMTNKRWGRIGDSPIIGAGTYANDRCGVSATGWGEFYIRATVAHDICARVAYRGDAIAKAADDVVLGVVPKLGGDGGVIALDRDGNVAMPFNTEGMYRGTIDAKGNVRILIYKEESPPAE